MRSSFLGTKTVIPGQNFTYRAYIPAQAGSLKYDNPDNCSPSMYVISVLSFPLLSPTHFTTHKYTTLLRIEEFVPWTSYNA